MRKTAAKFLRRRRSFDEHRHHQARRRGERCRPGQRTGHALPFPPARRAAFADIFRRRSCCRGDARRRADQAQSLFADGLAARHARIHDLGAPRRCRPRRLAVHAQARQARHRDGDQLSGQSVLARPARQEASDAGRRHRHHAVHGADRAAGGGMAAISSCITPAAPPRSAPMPMCSASATTAGSGYITTTATSASSSTGCCRRSRSARISTSAVRPA